jgi:hypothetical protein
LEFKNKQGTINGEGDQTWILGKWQFENKMTIKELGRPLALQITNKNTLKSRGKNKCKVPIFKLT